MNRRLIGESSGELCRYRSGIITPACFAGHEPLLPDELDTLNSHHPLCTRTRLLAQMTPLRGSLSGGRLLGLTGFANVVHKFLSAVDYLTSLHVAFVLGRG